MVSLKTNVILYHCLKLQQVLQGLLQASESVIVTKEMAAQLLVHEATHVFYDRLVDQDDRVCFYQCVSDELHNYFKVKKNNLARGEAGRDFKTLLRDKFYGRM